MDPEPYRCRRTDGKKWRCSKKAVQNEKYCEGHMHRGRNRGSRKLVEPKKIIRKIIPRPYIRTHVHSMIPIIYLVKSYSDNRITQNGLVQSQPGKNSDNRITRNDLGQSQPGQNKESSFENANPMKIESGTAKNNHPEFGSSPKSALHCGAVIGLSSQKSDHKSAMDPKPYRCQRTDGKKWRCSKKAVQNEKYCEGHMHRGRNRGSMKLVEPKKIIPKPYNRTNVYSVMPISSLVKSYSDNRITQNGLIQSQPGKNSDNRIARNGLGQSQPGQNKECSFESANPMKIESGTAKNNHPGFGSSLKSALHCGKVYPGTKNFTENVPQRCKRTDGKQWQCGQEALPDQKYCQRHMHRGTKRVMSNPLSPPPRKARTSCTIITSLDNSIDLNTIPISPRPVSDDDSTSSSSNEATTISD